MEHFGLGARGHLITPLRTKFGLEVAADPAFDRFDLLLQSEIIGHGVPNGIVTRELYEELFGVWPSTFERALMVVAYIENHGFFSTFNGNVDKAGVTAGIIGFTAKSGSLLRLLSAIDKGVIDAAFAEAGLKEKKEAFGKLLSLGSVTVDDDRLIEKKRVEEAVLLFTAEGRVTPAWTKFLRHVLSSPNGIETQRKRAKLEYFDKAEVKATENNLTSEYGRVLAFSSFVQSGGMTFTPPLSGGTERERRLIAAPRRAAQIAAAVANFERRHAALAKGIGFPNFRFTDLTKWGFASPDTPPPAKTRVQSIRLSAVPQLDAVKQFETEAMTQKLVEERVATPDLSKIWRPEFAIMEPPADRKKWRQPRSKAVHVLISVDELPLSILILGATSGSSTTFNVPGGAVGFKGKAGIVGFAATDLDLPLAPQMPNGLVILYGPAGIAEKRSFGQEVRRALDTVNDGAAPLVLGWMGWPSFPGPAGPHCAAAFFSAVKAAMAPADAPKSLDAMIFFSPDVIIQAWGKACHLTYAHQAPFSGLWRRTVKKGKNTVVAEACAAIAPNGAVWRAVANPANDVFMERI